MKNQKSLFVSIFFLFLSLFMVDRCFCAELNVPFQNTPISSNVTLISDYSFGPHAIIFCFDNTLNTNVSISWPYRGSIQTGNLPIFLKTKSNFEGSFADPAGQITMVTSNRNLTVSCLFGF